MPHVNKEHNSFLCLGPLVCLADPSLLLPCRFVWEQDRGGDAQCACQPGLKIVALQLNPVHCQYLQHSDTQAALQQTAVHCQQLQNTDEQAALQPNAVYCQQLQHGDPLAACYGQEVAWPVGKQKSSKIAFSWWL